VRLHEADEDYSPASSSDAEVTDDDDSDESEPERPVKRPKSLPQAVVPSGLKLEPGMSSVLTVERAKTGRARCRKCHEAIDTGSWRVGMQAWIMGRQAITWYSHHAADIGVTACELQAAPGLLYVAHQGG